jgi:hypothetical protein
VEVGAGLAESRLSPITLASSGVGGGASGRAGAAGGRAQATAHRAPKRNSEVRDWLMTTVLSA